MVSKDICVESRSLRPCIHRNGGDEHSSIYWGEGCLWRVVSASSLISWGGVVVFFGTQLLELSENSFPTSFSQFLSIRSLKSFCPTGTLEMVVLVDRSAP